MRKENHLNVSNFTCNITISSVGLKDDPHAHSVYDEHSIYDDLNTSSNHCTGNVNKPAYVSADSGPMPVSPETYNVTQDAINDLSHDAPVLLNDSHQSLQELPRYNINRIILAHLNINSVRNKLYFFAEFIKNNIDICLISETKIDKTFPKSQFLISGYSPPFRHDRTANGGGSLLHVREHIPSKLLDHKGITSDKNFECLFIEINLHGKKMVDRWNL